LKADDIANQLDRLREQSLLRKRRIVDSACGPEVVVDGKPVVAFCSNDYLGLAANPALVEAACAGARRYGMGSGASHLVSGHYTPHHALEEKLAAFVGMPRTLFFSTGYMANLGALTALAAPGDAVFSDELNHASIVDGVRLSGADKHIYPHVDMGTLEKMLAGCAAPRKLIATDAVFSMDGDLAPLPKLLELSERYDALLLVDDAHGFGVLGSQGRGSLSHWGLMDLGFEHASGAPSSPGRIPLTPCPSAPKEVALGHPRRGEGSDIGSLAACTVLSSRIVYVGTLGKAAGVSGAFVAGAEDIVEWLLQRARTYTYTTGTPPLLAQALLTSIDLIEQGNERRAHLMRLITQLRVGLRCRQWRLVESETAIQPLIIGENAEALRVSAALLEAGLWVPAIRPPTVPAGTARLRITLSAAHTMEQVQRLVDALLALE